MKSIKDLLDEKSQTLHEDIAAAIVKYQTETGIKIIKIHYDESSYCTLHINLIFTKRNRNET